MVTEASALPNLPRREYLLIPGLSPFSELEASLEDVSDIDPSVLLLSDVVSISDMDIGSCVLYCKKLILGLGLNKASELSVNGSVRDKLRFVGGVSASEASETEALRL